jgi:hypothetical protein
VQRLGEELDRARVVVGVGIGLASPDPLDRHLRVGVGRELLARHVQEVHLDRQEGLSAEPHQGSVLERAPVAGQHVQLTRHAGQVELGPRGEVRERKDVAGGSGVVAERLSRAVGVAQLGCGDHRDHGIGLERCDLAGAHRLVDGSRADHGQVPEVQAARGEAALERRQVDAVVGAAVAE